MSGMDFAMSLNRQYRTGAIAASALCLDHILDQVDGEPLDIPERAFIDGVTTLDNPASYKLVFLERVDPIHLEQLNAIDGTSMLFIVLPEYQYATRWPRVITKSPRAVYTQLVYRLFDYEGTFWEQQTAIHASARVDASARLSPGVFVGRNSVIGPECFIYPNVVIGPNCSIGSNCIIKSGSVIGQPGFGVFKDQQGYPQHFPHVGGVVVEHDVEIGALNTICAGSIHPTVVGAGVKTDDHVHIAHNCVVGRRTLVTACSELSGSVSIGEDCWIGPNSSIMDGLTIGKNVFIGIGSNVTKSLGDAVTVAGNPARQLHRAEGS
jgi:acetyltransferase-like isoleucine patch superfamily enzyme